MGFESMFSPDCTAPSGVSRYARRRAIRFPGWRSGRTVVAEATSKRHSGSENIEGDGRAKLRLLISFPDETTPPRGNEPSQG
jgi:hypothetical protein